MNRIRLESGRYVAGVALTLGLNHNDSEREYRLVKAGEEFEIPEYVNGFWASVNYHPDFGDPEPQFGKVAEAGEVSRDS